MCQKYINRLICINDFKLYLPVSEYIYSIAFLLCAFKVWLTRILSMTYNSSIWPFVAVCKTSEFKSILLRTNELVKYWLLFFIILSRSYFFGFYSSLIDNNNNLFHSKYEINHIPDHKLIMDYMGHHSLWLVCLVVSLFFNVFFLLKTFASLLWQLIGFSNWLRRYHCVKVCFQLSCSHFQQGFYKLGCVFDCPFVSARRTASYIVHCSYH